MAKETTHEMESRILKEYIANKVETLEKGEATYVYGGYIHHNYNDNLIDSNCSKIVTKLTSLGYEATTNHGHGCRDYRFTKVIDL